ncbi:hypothetical protein AKJ09_06775 [Labilithrix luteola]|uniref:Lipoprotein n=1 Tax=Labilithrix luteola TaxID=1391654 RepID=A0A0K1Q398_9BACT|nr:hypothetical protein [Labilithrix luteola]AKV00112.1 hypothetical protein AKJ09_06775 [Labilithrix luteola]
MRPNLSASNIAVVLATLVAGAGATAACGSSQPSAVNAHEVAPPATANAGGQASCSGAAHCGAAAHADGGK